MILKNGLYFLFFFKDCLLGSVFLTSPVLTTRFTLSLKRPDSRYLASSWQKSWSRGKRNESIWISMLAARARVHARTLNMQARDMVYACRRLSPKTFGHSLSSGGIDIARQTRLPISRNFSVLQTLSHIISKSHIIIINYIVIYISLNYSWIDWATI